MTKINVLLTIYMWRYEIWEFLFYFNPKPFFHIKREKNKNSQTGFCSDYQTKNHTKNVYLFCINRLTVFTRQEKTIFFFIVVFCISENCSVFKKTLVRFHQFWFGFLVLNQTGRIHNDLLTICENSYGTKLIIVHNKYHWIVKNIKTDNIQFSSLMMRPSKRLFSLSLDQFVAFFSVLQYIKK